MCHAILENNLVPDSCIIFAIFHDFFGCDMHANVVNDDDHPTDHHHCMRNNHGISENLY